MRRALAVALLVAAGAAQDDRGRREAWAAVGAEATVHLHGDEARATPGVRASSFYTTDTLTLVVGGESRPGDADTEIAVLKAVRANDRIGIEALERRGRLVRVGEGTRVLVVDYFLPTGDFYLSLIPTAGYGAREVRVLEGDLKGRSGWLPARNLQVYGKSPPEPVKPRRKR